MAESKDTSEVVGHTPGPWRVDESFSLPSVIAPCFPKGAKCVAVVYGDAVLLARVPDSLDGLRLADARLIAAAPDLLACCKQLVGFIGLCPTMPISATSLTQILEQFDAAVAKAEPAPVRESARPCGCDPGESYTCAQHRGSDVQA